MHGIERLKNENFLLAIKMTRIYVYQAVQLKLMCSVFFNACMLSPDNSQLERVQTLNHMPNSEVSIFTYSGI